MLHPADTPEPPQPAAYCVPWLVTRRDRSHPTVRNAGGEPVDFVKVLRSDADHGRAIELWGQVLPSETIELCLCGADPDDIVITIAWFRQQDGLEYVWRFVL